MRIYLDNNATTPIHPQVMEVLVRTSSEVFGNASSIHKEGQTARRVLEEARDAVADLVHSTPREIVFTSGGTESNNAAILGVVGDSKLCHIVTTAIEHPSVLELIRELESRGLAEVTIIPAGPDGRVDAEQMIGAIGTETRLVAVMLANNETGVIQPVRAIGAFCRERGIHLHCDAVQAAGKIPINVAELGVDTLALSGHKFHAPKGVGALYVRSGATLRPLIYGGAQERRRRSGTEPVPNIAALGAAARIAADLAPTRTVQALRDRLEAELLGALPNARVNGSGSPRLPNTSSIRFTGADAEAIVIGMDLQGVAVSSGSACSSGRVEPSKVLLAMGLSEQEARSSVRISLSRFTTQHELDVAARLFRKLVTATAPEVLAGNV